MPKRPGRELAPPPLHFIWIADCSGSMSIEGKIQALNTAIREAIPHMQGVANENPNADVLIALSNFPPARSGIYHSPHLWQISNGQT